jgi:hypothetical protein
MCLTKLEPGGVGSLAPVSDSPGYATIDLDGVVADVRHRLSYVERRPKDWDAFFAAAVDDPVLPEGRAVVSRLVAEGHEIVYVTGRPERCRRDTERWLRDHGFPEARLIMRGDRDHRPSRVIKLEVLRRLARKKPVVAAVDDDVLVVKALREAGFPVLHAEWMAEQPALFEAQETEGRT